MKTKRAALILACGLVACENSETALAAKKPLARNDQFTVPKDSGPKVLHVLKNDRNAGVTLSLTSAGPLSAGGSARIINNGSRVEYRPASGFAGQESFRYSAANSRGNTSALVSITVSGVAPPPPPPPPPPERVTLQQLHAEIFVNCSPCHSGPTGNRLPRGMDLSTVASAHANLVGISSLQRPGVLRVAPAHPDASYLIRKLDGSDISGTRMPPNGPYLDNTQMNRIRSWISDGALLD
ncbi:MAG: Ig-like domain-containing protein [Panacagrimonas sp.]